jgi:hypothetical protein
MAELFLQISVSLDGYIEDRNHDIEWLTSDTRGAILYRGPEMVGRLP